MSYFIDHSKKNEKHVKSSDSDKHVTQKLLTLKGLRNYKNWFQRNKYACTNNILIYDT